MPRLRCEASLSFCCTGCDPWPFFGEAAGNGGNQLKMEVIGPVFFLFVFFFLGGFFDFLGIFRFFEFSSLRVFEFSRVFQFSEFDFLEFCFRELYKNSVECRQMK